MSLSCPVLTLSLQVRRQNQLWEGVSTTHIERMRLLQGGDPSGGPQSVPARAVPTKRPEQGLEFQGHLGQLWPWLVFRQQVPETQLDSGGRGQTCGNQQRPPSPGRPLLTPTLNPKGCTSPHTLLGSLTLPAPAYRTPDSVRGSSLGFGHCTAPCQPYGKVGTRLVAQAHDAQASVFMGRVCMRVVCTRVCNVQVHVCVMCTCVCERSHRSCCWCHLPHGPFAKGHTAGIAVQLGLPVSFSKNA